ncbi:hypothetical protein F7725_023811 [Dissostichus mawsoni]|uniref:Glucagon / GIP / secretin / VIP family domain-containing protein n=1 Tax=Dissostichus mawsoni TaxID=36200 RepID=A0A7J5XXQ9_DISMA|nr:hypothetical protein F7725_023811 [Dissostichus mawsoni]
MLQRTGPQLLFLIALCSVLYSRTLSLPYTSMRPTRHADGLFTSGYSKLLGQLSARRYLESLIGKRVSDELMEEPVKRHSDAIFTDNYSRFRKQMAVKKYLNSVLTEREGRHPSNLESWHQRGRGVQRRPNTFQESYDDINVDHLLNNFHLINDPESLREGKATAQINQQLFTTLTAAAALTLHRNVHLALSRRMLLLLRVLLGRIGVVSGVEKRDRDFTTLQGAEPWNFSWQWVQKSNGS